MKDLKKYCLIGFMCEARRYLRFAGFVNLPIRTKKTLSDHNAHTDPIHRKFMIMQLYKMFTLHNNIRIIMIYKYVMTCYLSSVVN